MTSCRKLINQSTSYHYLFFGCLTKNLDNIFFSLTHLLCISQTKLHFFFCLFFSDTFSIFFFHSHNIYKSLSLLIYIYFNFSHFLSYLYYFYFSSLPVPIFPSFLSSISHTPSTNKSIYQYYISFLHFLSPCLSSIYIHRPKIKDSFF